MWEVGNADVPHGGGVGDVRQRVRPVGCADRYSPMVRRIAFTYTLAPNQGRFDQTKLLVRYTKNHFKIFSFVTLCLA